VDGQLIQKYPLSINIWLTCSGLDEIIIPIDYIPTTCNYIVDDEMNEILYVSSTGVQIHAIRELIIAQCQKTSEGRLSNSDL
jgi:hypothetical protein